MKNKRTQPSTEKRSPKKVTLQKFYDEFREHKEESKVRIDQFYGEFVEYKHDSKVKIDQFYEEFREHKEEFREFKQETKRRFDENDRRFDDNDHHFTNIYREFAELKDGMYTRLDFLIAKYEKHDQENAMRDQDLKRHEVMLKRVNTTLNLPHVEAV